MQKILRGLSCAAIAATAAMCFSGHAAAAPAVPASAVKAGLPFHVTPVQYRYLEGYNRGYLDGTYDYRRPRYGYPRYGYHRPHYPGWGCGYWKRRCADNWYFHDDYYGCLRYHGCYGY